jgi:hypothetical protein
VKVSKTGDPIAVVYVAERTGKEFQPIRTKDLSRGLGGQLSSAQLSSAQLREMACGHEHVRVHRGVLVSTSLEKVGPSLDSIWTRKRNWTTSSPPLDMLNSEIRERR